MELEEKRDGETSESEIEAAEAPAAVIGIVSLISTEVNVTGDMGDEAASACEARWLLLRYVGGLNKRASADTEVAKTSAVVTVLFFEARFLCRCLRWCWCA